MAVRFSSGTDEYTASTGLPTANVWTATWWTQLVTDRNDFSCQFSVGVNGAYVDVSSAADGTTIGVYDPVTYSSTPLGATAFTVGSWYRVGLSVNGTTANFYRAIVTATTLTVSTASGDFTAVNPPLGLSIGDSVNFGNYFWSGRIAAFKMWNAALTQAEIEIELAQYQPRRTANILRFHPFVKTETVDYSGSANTLSGSGSTTEDGPPIPWTAQQSRVVTPVAAGTDYVKTVTDPVGIVDTATRVLSAVRSITNVVGVVDSVATVLSVSRPVTDVIGIVDNATDVNTLVRLLTNPVGIVDEVSDASIESVTDLVGIVDSVTDAWALTRTNSDIVGVTDNLTVATTRGVTDVIGITDAVSDSSIEDLTDSVSIADSTSDLWTLSRVVIDPIGVIDSITDTWTITRTITDNVGVLDDASGTLGGVSRTVVDPIGITDSSVTTRSSARSTVDPVGLTDGLVGAVTSARSLTNSVGIVDAVQATTGLSATRTDVVGIVDSASQAITKIAVVTDTMGIIDGATRVSVGFAAITNIMGILDSVSGAITGPQTGLRTRVSGREPSSNAGSGREPTHRISGSEVATL